jgi:hypothetical protein
MSWLSLSTPDASTNHNEASAKRRSTTGTWFLGCAQFASWNVLPHSFLWMHGKTGCGKTILNSTVVRALIDKHRASSGSRIVAYFYFDYADERKQKHQNMLRSVAAQLFAQSRAIPNVLTSVFDTCLRGLHQPSSQQILQIIRCLIENSDDTFILLDALDECKDLDELLENIETMSSWNLEKLHVFVTSRNEYQIEQTISAIAGDAIISLDDSVVDEDINIYITERLKTDPILRRWKNRPDIQAEIFSALTQKCQGM